MSIVTPARTTRTTWEREVDSARPSKREIDHVVLDYLITEGYPEVAKLFAHDADLKLPDEQSMWSRMSVRNAIHDGDAGKAIELLNDFNAEILDNDGLLHFRLLQMQLIEIIRPVLAKGKDVNVEEFRPALEFARNQLAPRVPTGDEYRKIMEHTMALMIFDPMHAGPELTSLLDHNLRYNLASAVNKAMLDSRKESSEAKILQLERTNVWAELRAGEAKLGIPPKDDDDYDDPMVS